MKSPTGTERTELPRSPDSIALHQPREAARCTVSYFSNIRPTATLERVSLFIDPRWLVETEIDAIIDEGE